MTVSVVEDCLRSVRHVAPVVLPHRIRTDSSDRSADDLVAAALERVAVE